LWWKTIRADDQIKVLAATSDIRKHRNIMPCVTEHDEVKWVVDYHSILSSAVEIREGRIPCILKKHWSHSFAATNDQVQISIEIDIIQRWHSIGQLFH
jgi:hypothetical protein